MTTTTRYLYDGMNIIAEYDENNTMKAQYIQNLGIDDQLAMIKNGNTYYYHKDGLGSITKISDSTGSVVQSYAYDSFGNIASTLNPNFVQPYTFTAREYDAETGLYFYRARYYDANVGRFISEDPIGFSAGDVNVYRYVFNNPGNLTDPMGLDAELCKRMMLTPIPYARHCYIRFNGDKKNTLSFDEKGVNKDPAPSWWPGQSCSPTKGKQDDECVKKEMNKCKAEDYDFTGYNCCHCAENALKSCGQNSSTGWPNWPINPGPQPGESGYKP